MLRSITLVIFAAFFAASVNATHSLINKPPMPDDQVKSYIEEVLQGADKISPLDLADQLAKDAEAAINIDIDSLPQQSINLDALPIIAEDAHAKIQADLAKLLKDMESQDNPSLEVQPITEGNLFILASFSMPNQLIQALGQEALAAGGNLLFRGLIENDFKVTFERINELANGNELPIVLDPVTFARFNTERVPTFVVASGLEACDAEQPCNDLSYSKLAGAITLDYALTTIKNSAKDPKVKTLAKNFLSNLER